MNAPRRHLLALSPLLVLAFACRTTASPVGVQSGAEGNAPVTAVSNEAGEPQEEAPTMTSSPLTVSGVLEKHLTVGYRSPYRLVVSEAESLARVRELIATEESPVFLTVRGASDVLDPLLEKTVGVVGSWIVQSAEQADPGSEAESRFVGGLIPPMTYLEVKEIHQVD